MTTSKDGPQTIDTRIGALEFTHDFANGYPTDATVQKLYDERDFQRDRPGRVRAHLRGRAEQPCV